jgi:hypothetical protein
MARLKPCPSENGGACPAPCGAGDRAHALADYPGVSRRADFVFRWQETQGDQLRADHALPGGQRLSEESGAVFEEAAGG